MTAAAAEPAPDWRRWVLAAVAVAAAFLAFGLLAEAFVPAPAGPTGSSYATTPGGAAAWAQLLQREGHPVDPLRRSLAETRLPPELTLVVLDAPSLSGAAAHSVERFVQAGGRLVIAGGTPSATLPALLTHPPRFRATGSPLVHPVARLPEVSGVRTIRTIGAGAWSSGPGTPALAGPKGTLLLVLQQGQGQIDLLADASPLENGLLADADNAQLALNLAGGPRRPVIFAEALHGFGLATGLAAIPVRWWLAFAGLGLAGGLWALARGRRLGPPEAPAPEPAPPRSAYVDAMATALVRTRDRRALERALNGGDG